MLQIKNLYFSAEGENGEVHILKDLCLDIGKGKLVAITGPNGGGKTTLAKAIMGLIKPTGGQILYEGTDISALGVTERAKLGISYGFQQPPRFKGLGVRDLLEIASGKKLETDECCALLTQVGLCSNDYLNRDVDTSLSGGEVKRIEIATILARKSKLMIYDEPEAGIDLWSFSRLTETFRSIHEKSEATIVIISHQERILQLADEIVLVSDGKVQGKGSPEEMFPQILGNTAHACCYLN